MTARLAVRPEMLDWAIQRSRIEPGLRKAFGKVEAWRSGEEEPTFKQLVAFANATYTPFGYLLLETPPHEELPIGDFRTFGNKRHGVPSVNLLDVTNDCLGKQEWYKEFSLRNGFEPLPFVGTRTTTDDVIEVAAWLRSLLNSEISERTNHASPDVTIKAITSELEMHGCLVMSSGIVKSNTRRKLDLEEFRGFAIADEIAPLVFINANDSKAGRIFSLIHEFGHVLLGKSGISDSSSNDVPQDSASHSQDELWCNALAAEFLVPESYIKVQFQKGISPRRVNEVARITKASTLVVIKQLFKVGLIGWDEYEELYTTELKHLQANLANAAKKSGGDYYRTQVSRLSRNFVRAVISDTLSGRTLHRDAYDLLGTKKSATFEKLASSVGLA